MIMTAFNTIKECPYESGGMHQARIICTPPDTLDFDLPVKQGLLGTVLQVFRVLIVEQCYPASALKVAQHPWVRLSPEMGSCYPPNDSAQMK